NNDLAEILEKSFKSFTNNQREILTRYFTRGGDFISLKLQFGLPQAMGDEEFVQYLKNFIRTYGLDKLELKLDTTPAPKKPNRDSTAQIQKSSFLPKMNLGEDGTQVIRKQTNRRFEAQLSDVISQKYEKELADEPTQPKPEIVQQTSPNEVGQFVEIKEAPKAKPTPLPEPAKPPKYFVPPIATCADTRSLSEEQLAKRNAVIEAKEKGLLGPPTATWDGKTERRVAEERRSGEDRRDSVETIFKNKRFGKERRSGKDRRQKY
ncbi:MAG: hypothetical protein ACFCU1_06305, partial [Sumerlaeia bacterium]